MPKSFLGQFSKSITPLPSNTVTIYVPCTIATMTIYMIQSEVPPGVTVTHVLLSSGYFKNEEDAQTEVTRLRNWYLDQQRMHLWNKALQEVQLKQWEWDMDTSADAWGRSDKRPKNLVEAEVMETLQLGEPTYDVGQVQNMSAPEEAPLYVVTKKTHVDFFDDPAFYLISPFIEGFSLTEEAASKAVQELQDLRDQETRATGEQYLDVKINLWNERLAAGRDVLLEESIGIENDPFFEALFFYDDPLIEENAEKYRRVGTITLPLNVVAVEEHQFLPSS